MSFDLLYIKTNKISISFQILIQILTYIRLSGLAKEFHKDISRISKVLILITSMIITFCILL